MDLHQNLGKGFQSVLPASGVNSEERGDFETKIPFPHTWSLLPADSVLCSRVLSAFLAKYSEGN